MAYEKQTFVDGETIISAQIFEHIEDGIVAVESAAGDAATAASNAQDEASQAQGVATLAKAAVDSATAVANEAKTAAESAQTVANEAKTAAESAQTAANGKQDKLVSGENIKTVNGQSILGSGDIAVSGGSGTKWYTGKKVSVLGDSISTFNGYNPVDERQPTYPSGAVNAWNLTWWGRIIEKLGLELAMNDSWSGSNVYNGGTTDNPAGNSGPSVCMAGLKRIQNLGANGTPDIIFFFGGTNDVRFIKGGGEKLGEFDETADYSTVDLDTIKWTSFVDAYVAAIMRLQYYYPNAFIVAMTPMFTTHSAWSSQEKLQLLCEEVRKICNYFGCVHIDMRKSGIKMTNAAKFLKDGLHPDKIGMQMMADYLISQLEPMLANYASTGATEPELETLEQLATPVVTISESGLASWAAVSNATGYGYSINGANAVTTTELSVQLTEGQSIKVKAFGDGVTYSDSQFSETVTYSTTTEPEEPENPDVELPTETTWYVDFTSEPINYKYSAGTQGAVTFANDETRAKCVGVPINAVKLHVVSPAVMGVIRVLPDGDSFEPICDITLTGGTEDASESTPTVFKLEKTVVLGEGERLGVARNAYPSGGPYAAIWVSTTSTNALAQVHTNVRGNGGAKDESWKLPIGVGYVVD